MPVVLVTWRWAIHCSLFSSLQVFSWPLSMTALTTYQSIKMFSQFPGLFCWRICVDFFTRVLKHFDVDWGIVPGYKFKCFSMLTIHAIFLHIGRLCRFTDTLGGWTDHALLKLPTVSGSALLAFGTLVQTENIILAHSFHFTKIWIGLKVVNNNRLHPWTRNLGGQRRRWHSEPSPALGLAMNHVIHGDQVVPYSLSADFFEFRLRHQSFGYYLADHPTSFSLTRQKPLVT